MIAANEPLSFRKAHSSSGIQLSGSKPITKINKSIFINCSWKVLPASKLLMSEHFATFSIWFDVSSNGVDIFCSEVFAEFIVSSTSKIL